MKRIALRNDNSLSLADPTSPPLQFGNDVHTSRTILKGELWQTTSKSGCFIFKKHQLGEYFAENQFAATSLIEHILPRDVCGMVEQLFPRYAESIARWSNSRDVLSSAEASFHKLRPYNRSRRT